MNTKSLVSISDLSREEILSLLDTAQKFEERPNRRLLEGKVVATLFSSRQPARDSVLKQP